MSRALRYDVITRYGITRFYLWLTHLSTNETSRPYLSFLPSQTASWWYSFCVPLRTGGWAGLAGWDTEAVCPLNPVTYPNTNRVQHWDQCTTTKPWCKQQGNCSYHRLHPDPVLPSGEYTPFMHHQQLTIMCKYNVIHKSKVHDMF